MRSVVPALIAPMALVITVALGSARVATATRLTLERHAELNELAIGLVERGVELAAELKGCGSAPCGEAIVHAFVRRTPGSSLTIRRPPGTESLVVMEIVVEEGVITVSAASIVGMMLRADASSGAYRPSADGDSDEPGNRGDAELLHDATPVVVDGLAAETEEHADLLRVLPGGEHPKHLELPFGERIERITRVRLTVGDRSRSIVDRPQTGVQNDTAGG